MRSLLIAVTATLIFCQPAVGQTGQEQFSNRGDRLPDGSKPNVSFDLSKTIKNWAGTDGLGCCVMASNRNNAIHLGMPDVGQKIYDVSVNQEGGHWHQKYLEQMKQVEADFPGLKYWSDPAADYDELVEYSERGLPIGITIGTGARYNMQVISHMVSAVKVGRDNELSAICDNNFPNEISAMPTPVFKKRIIINSPTGKPWATIIFPLIDDDDNDNDEERCDNKSSLLFIAMCVAVSSWTWVIASKFFD